MSLPLLSLGMAGEQWLLPAACVAQIVQQPKPDPSTLQAPWLIGLLNWTDRRIALLDIGPMREPAVSTEPVFAAVLADSLSPGRYYALAVAAEPQLLQATAAELDTLSGPCEGPVAGRTHCRGQDYLIPALDSIEQQIARLLAG